MTSSAICIFKKCRRFFTLPFQRKEGKAKKYTAGKFVYIRPASNESHSEFGLFGVNTVESGCNGTGCVFTIVERKTRKLFACRPEPCTAGKFYNALKKINEKSSS